MPPSIATAVPFADLINHSFDEAAFLWRRWEHELASPTRNLDEVWLWTEDRLHGALDGVRVAGTGLVDIATSALLADDIDRVTVGAATLASSTDQTATDAITAALHAADGPRLAAMLRGVELLGGRQALRAAAAMLVTRGATGAGALCRLKAFLRAAPGEELATAFQSDEQEARIAAIRAARHQEAPQAEPSILAALDDDHPLVRVAAVESGMCRGFPRAWETAARAARQLDPNAAPYVKLLAMRGVGDDHEIVFAALRVPVLQLAAIWALGHIGTPRAAEACLAGMQHEKLARACGEAYCWITGADLGRDGLASPETRPEAPAFEDDDLDANLVPPTEASWALPNLEAVRRDWSTRQSRLTGDVRHVHGRPATTHELVTMVESGPMLRRPDLAFELRVRSRGAYDVEPFAFCARQRQMMSAGRAGLSSHSER